MIAICPICEKELEFFGKQFHIKDGKKYRFYNCTRHIPCTEITFEDKGVGLCK